MHTIPAHRALDWIPKDCPRKVRCAQLPALGSLWVGMELPCSSYGEDGALPNMAQGAGAPQAGPWHPQGGRFLMPGKPPSLLGMQ